VMSLTASAIITPNCFHKNLGRKQIHIDGYKELAYLGPDYFKPDISIFDELGIARNEDYVILRFNVFDAIHDIGKRGFGNLDKRVLADSLSKYAHVFISPEGKLSKDLEKYSLPIPQSRIHHALYFSKLLVTDTQTMTTEAAILGVPVVRCNNFVGPNDMGNFIELEKKYGLIFSFSESDLAVQKATELIKLPNMKKEWALKRQKFLEDKVDVTKFFVDFIENYPESFRKYREKNG
jgi:predicted glycosyltransferase